MPRPCKPAYGDRSAERCNRPDLGLSIATAMPASAQGLASEVTAALKLRLPKTMFSGSIIREEIVAAIESKHTAKIDFQKLFGD